jgi:membrane protease subunit (stomatin/prohibitin family)
MGLIRAALGAATSVLGDQWKDYFYCESLPSDVIATKGRKKKAGIGGGDNIITNGSTISVADGQCMIIVEQGKVVDYCAEAGEFVYDQSTEPSLFDDGKLADNVKTVFANMGKRFTYGGVAPKDQRIYYFNTKEMVGKKYGTPNPVPFRIVDERAGIDIDISIKCFGEYSFKLTNPILFYTNVCGNIEGSYTTDRIEGQMRTELLTALQPAFAKISEKGVRYSQLPAHADDLAEFLNSELSSKWKDLRGLEIVSFGVSSVTAKEEDEKMLKELQRNAAFRDPSLGNAYLVGATGAAMQDAANNPNGSMGAFVGMGMSGAVGANASQGFYGGVQHQAPQQASAQVSPEDAANRWFCPNCGYECFSNFCPKCGTKKP